MKIIIAGSRDIEDYALLERVMVESNAFAKVTEVVSGGAKGVDKMGERWARANKVKLTVMKADWDNCDVPGAVVDVHPNGGYYNSRAGLQRNEEMGQYADALIALWNGSPGTRHMIDYMKKLGKHVYVRRVEKQKKDNKKK